MQLLYLSVFFYSQYFACKGNKVFFFWGGGYIFFSNSTACIFFFGENREIVHKRNSSDCDSVFFSFDDKIKEMCLVLYVMSMKILTCDIRTKSPSCFARY